MTKIRVFMSIRFIRKTGSRDVQHRSEWISRGTGCLMYRSKTVDTIDLARELAYKYLRSKRGENLVDTINRSAWKIEEE